MDGKLKSRTFWIVFSMFLVSSALAYIQEWSGPQLGAVWVILLGAWVGGKGVQGWQANNRGGK